MGIAEDDSASSQEFEVQATEGLCSFKSSETVKTARGSNLENHELERQIPSVSDLSLNAKVTTERMDDCMEEALQSLVALLVKLDARMDCLLDRSYVAPFCETMEKSVQRINLLLGRLVTLQSEQTSQKVPQRPIL